MESTAAQHYIVLRPLGLIEVPSWAEPFRLHILHRVVSTSLENPSDDLHFL